MGSGNTIVHPGAVNLDSVRYPNVHVVADAHNIPFRDNHFDCVFCNAVLEHTRQPWIVAKEIERVLKVNGIAIVQVPFLEGVHDKEDYFRFTPKGLLSLFPQMMIIETGATGSMNQILADLVRVHPVLVAEGICEGAPVKAVKLVMGWLAKPIQHLDFMIDGSPNRSKYVRSHYFVGRKM